MRAIIGSVECGRMCLGGLQQVVAGFPYNGG